MWELFCRFRDRSLGAAADGFWKVAPWAFLFAGVICLALAHFLISPTNQSAWHGFLVSLGSLMLSAGVFSIVLKSFQYIKVFREELLKLFQEEDFERILRKVIFAESSDEASVRRLIEPLMREYVSAHNPQLVDGALAELDHLLQVCVADAHFRHFKRTIRLTKYDPGLRKLDIDDELFIELVPTDNGKNVVYESTITSEGSKFTRGTLKVNGIDVSSKINVNDHTVGYRLELHGSKSYTIARRYHKSIDLRRDPYVHLRLTRSTLNLALNVENCVADQVKVIVRASGFDPSFKVSRWQLNETSESDSTGRLSSQTIEMTKDSLTLPNQGYVMFFGTQ